MYRLVVLVIPSYDNALAETIGLAIHSNRLHSRLHEALLSRQPTCQGIDCVAQRATIGR